MGFYTSIINVINEGFKNMKITKVVAGVLVASIVVLGGAGSASAATQALSEVTGVVTENHTAVANASVTVSCNGKSEMDTTDSAGSYRVAFLKADCDFGATVKVVATKDGKSGVASGTLQGITTKLNLAIVNVSVPELGTLGLVVAGTAGLGLMTLMRRRQAQM
jgi:hypothetical protein